MLELEEAQKKILEAVQVLPSELAILTEADGRVLTARIISPIDLPSFDNSAVDGYAVQSENLKAASRATPIALQLIGRIVAGESGAVQLQSGECVRIFTGSPVPVGANAVAMQEDTQVAQNANQIHFLDSVKPWENIRFRGEDVKTEATLIEGGTRLSAGQLSLLAAVGVEKLQVGRAPIVGILATGSELVCSRELLNDTDHLGPNRDIKDPSYNTGKALRPGQIFESNRMGLASLARKIGAVPKIYPLVSDSLAATKAALEKSFAECDAVVTTGGVSVGDLDFVKTAFTELGGTLDFWKIAIKPGKPFVFGQFQKKPLFGLPGNPVSALVTFILLVAPALAKMQGAKDYAWPRHPGVLGERLENRGDRKHFVRVYIDPKGNVRSSGTQASHILSSLAQANGLLEVPRETTFEKGAAVSVLRWEI